MSTYKFGEYTLRPATREDLEFAREWTAADPDHAGKVAPEFWIDAEPGAECYLLIDGAERPAYFFKMSRAIRIHMQFAPAISRDEKERMAAAITAGFDWLRAGSEKAGFREIIFQSTVAPLIRFCKNRFGFKESSNELVCGITPPNPQTSQENDARQ